MRQIVDLVPFTNHIYLWQLLLTLHLLSWLCTLNDSHRCYPFCMIMVTGSTFAIKIVFFTVKICSCLYSTFLLEYPMVLSRFCSELYNGSLNKVLASTICRARVLYRVNILTEQRQKYTKWLRSSHAYYAYDVWKVGGVIYGFTHLAGGLFIAGI